MKKIEQDFIDTVSKVASSTNERAGPELRALVERATRLGTETGRQTGKLMAEFTFTGMELAGQFSVRFAQMASGVLAGMADALEKSAAERRKHS
jgi:hypothetical protein